MTELSLSEQAYGQLRRMIVRLDFAPGDVLREDALLASPGVVLGSLLAFFSA